MVASYLFAFGAIVGSFLNVCIFRLVKDQDIIFKKSFCRKCKKKFLGTKIFPYLVICFYWVDVPSAKILLVYNIQLLNCYQEQYLFIHIFTMA